MLWIPAGFAHGFRVLSEKAHVLYKATDFYAPEHERTLAWNDPHLKINWELEGVADRVGERPAGRRFSAMRRVSNRFPCASQFLAPPVFWAKHLMREWSGRYCDRSQFARCRYPRCASSAGSRAGHSSRVDRAGRGLYRCGRMRKQSGPGLCCEPRWSGERGRSGKGARSTASVSSAPIMFSMEGKTHRTKLATSAIRRAYTDKTKAEAEIKLLGIATGLLHRPNVVALRNRRKMFSRYDLEAGCEPSDARCGQ